MSDNIIPFPSKGEREEKQSQLEIEYYAEDQFREMDINETISEIMPILLSLIYDEGYDIAMDDNVESVLLISDSIRSAIYNVLDMKHPLQEIAEEIYTVMVDEAFNDNIDVSKLTDPYQGLSANNDIGD